jgi:hypothetical protein
LEDWCPERRAGQEAPADKVDRADVAEDNFSAKAAEGLGGQAVSEEEVAVECLEDAEGWGAKR